MNIKLAIIAAATLVPTILPAQTAIPVTAATNVTISGLLAVGVKQSTYSPTGGAASFSDNYMGDNTSRLTIMSTSKIADGWNVIFRLGCRFEATYGPGTNILPQWPYQPVNLGTKTGTNTALQSGASTGSFYGSLGEDDTWGGIQSPYGTVTFGKSTIWITDSVDMNYLGVPSAGENYRIWDANGLAVFNILDTVQTTGGAANTLNITRSQGVLQYISPKFNDIQAQVAWSKNPYNSALQNGNATNGLNYENGDTLYGKIQYNSGPVSAFLSLLKIKAQGGPGGPDAYVNIGTDAAPVYYGVPLLTPPFGTPNVEAYRIGVSYRAMGFKAGVVVDHTSNVLTLNGPSQARLAYSIPLSYMWDKHGVYLTYSNAGNMSLGGKSMDNTGATQLNLVYDYALTSRAFIGVFFTSISNNNNAEYGPFLNGTNLGPSATPGMGFTWHQLGLNMNYWF